MKPDKKIYDKIQPLYPYSIEPVSLINFRSVYCINCGETYALYSSSVDKPHGLDENHKPFYDSCFQCQDDAGIYLYPVKF